MDDDVTDRCRQRGENDDVSAGSDVADRETLPQTPLRLTRRSLVRIGAIALVGSIAGCSASESSADTQTTETTAADSTTSEVTATTIETASPTSGTETQGSGRIPPDNPNIVISNNSTNTHDVSVAISESDRTDFDTMPVRFTPTTVASSQASVFQREVTLAPEAENDYIDVFPEPDERVAYRVGVRLGNGTSGGLLFYDYPNSGFAALEIAIQPGSDILISRGVV